MNARYSEVTSIASSNRLIDPKKLSKILVGGLIFAVVILIYFVGLQLISPFDTEVIVEGKDISEPNLIEEIVVHVSGAVQEPGIYRLSEKSRVADAISAAGGIMSNSNEDWVTKQLNLSSYIQDEQKIYVPFEWDSFNVEKPVEVTAFMDNSSEKKDKNFKTDNEDLVNVNLASQSDLINLKGIGEVYAGMLVDNRPYANLEDIKTKTKIPDKTLENISKKLTFD